MLKFLDDQLTPLWNKVVSGERLSVEDCQTLYNSPDILGVGWMANQVKEKRWGKKAFYVLNQKIEPTNECVLDCSFCDFAAKPKSERAYRMSIDEILSKCSDEITEVHVSGGMPPDWRMADYETIVRSIHEKFPHVAIKAFTAVEIEWCARVSKLSVEEVLTHLKAVGLAALPGGGAEVFSDRVRAELFPHKIGYREWLSVHRKAHELGIPSNATLLYGHIETPQERWVHLDLLRKTQDKAPGFMSFIPLAFQPGTTGLKTQSPTMNDDLKMLAISRLFLDNFPHIKAYWITLGEETASVGLQFGADDIDGTIGGEKIMHAAGAQSPTGLLVNRLEQLIKEARCIPVQRDGLYNEVPLVAQEFVQTV